MLNFCLCWSKPCLRHISKMLNFDSSTFYYMNSVNRKPKSTNRKPKSHFGFKTEPNRNRRLWNRTEPKTEKTLTVQALLSTVFPSWNPRRPRSTSLKDHYSPEEEAGKVLFSYLRRIYHPILRLLCQFRKKFRFLCQIKAGGNRSAILSRKMIVGSYVGK